MRADATPQCFADRQQAGQRLAELLAQPAPEAGTVVLALARGGLPIGVAIARRLGLPLEPLIVRKLGLPAFPEFAIGAIASGGICVLDQDVIKALKVTTEVVDQLILAQRRVLAERERRYGPSVPLSHLKHRALIVCDDGMATGRSMQAAIAALRAAEAGDITVAVPVLSREALQRVAPLVRQVRYLLCPPLFDAVGQWYRKFPQLGDNEVISLLSQVQRLPTHVSVSSKAST